jgi:hypothetical protein
VGPPTEFVNFKGWVKKIGEHHMGLCRLHLLYGMSLTPKKKAPKKNEFLFIMSKHFNVGI